MHPIGWWPDVWTAWICGLFPVHGQRRMHYRMRSSHVPGAHSLAEIRAMLDFLAEERVVFWRAWAVFVTYMLTSIAAMLGDQVWAFVLGYAWFLTCLFVGIARHARWFQIYRCLTHIEVGRIFPEEVLNA